MICRLMFVPLVAWAAYSQTKPSDELKFSFNGVGVALHTESSASHSPVSTSGAVTMGNDSTPYRIVVDRDDRPLFAYELELQKGPQSTVRVTIRPANQERLRALEWLNGKVVGAVPTISTVRKFPPLRLGDEVHVDIMYNPGTGEKLTDVLRIAPEAQQPPVKSEKVFTGPQFSWEGVKVAIDGSIVADKGGSWMIGEAIMVRVPAHGEYYMALRPPAGFAFQPTGWVDHNVLRFRTAGELVEVTGKSNLLMKSDTGTVWIYHVPEVRARGKADSVDITCSGDVDLLMHPEREKED